MIRFIVSTVLAFSFVCKAVNCFPRDFLSQQEVDTLQFNSGSGCPFSKRYQKIDGYCNNHANPKAGSTFTPLRRLLLSDYADGIQTPRRAQDGGALPNSRMISSTFKNAGVDHVDSIIFSHMMVQLGQFLAHDTVNTPLTKDDDMNDIKCTCESERPECIQIVIPSDDSLREKRSCIPLVRSAVYPGTSKDGSPRQQFNTITAYWDGNTVYGSDSKLSNDLRDTNSESGELIVRKGPNGYSSDTLPLVGQVTGEKKGDFACPAHLHSNKDTCYAAGEGRVNENIGLICMHAVFMREHNRIARELKTMNPHWSGNDTFWETRKIISAITQQITYREFLPLLVGKQNMDSYDMNVMRSGFYYGYDQTYDASISNVWATAAFRYGHTMVRMDVKQFDSDYKPVNKIVGIHDTLFNPSGLQNGTSFQESNIIRGLLQDPAENTDMHMNEGLRSLMFESEKQPGVDLMAINIKRGREHGLPGYNQYRAFCGLRKAINFDDLNGEISPDKVAILASVYSHVDDIDIYVGGVSETPIKNAAVGPTFACLNSEQFRALKKGDRSWFENPGSFSYGQLQELRKVSLSSLLCDNEIDMKSIQPNALLLESVQGNQRVPCSDIPRMDLSKWKDTLSNYEEEFGVWSRWFPQNERDSVQNFMDAQLTQHSDQLCRSPIRYEVQPLNAKNGWQKIRFLCPGGTISYSNFPKSMKGYTWTRWMDRDTPDSNGDDVESVDRLVVENSQDMCPTPIAIQTKALTKARGIESQDAIDHLSPTGGLICRGQQQISGKCSDYAVRFLCPNTFFEEQDTFMKSIDKIKHEWTDWMNSDTGEGKGDFESAALSRFLGEPVCKHPLMIEGRLVGNIGITVAKTNDVLKRFSPLYGLQCRDEDQENGKCHDYEVRYLCRKKR